MTEELKTTRLCYIEDINKAQKYLIKRPLSVEEFDYLYELPLDSLEHLLIHFEITISKVDEFTKSVDNLEKR